MLIFYSCSKIEAESRHTSLGGGATVDASGTLADALSGGSPEAAAPRGSELPLPPRLSTAGATATSTALTEPPTKKADSGGSLLDDVGALLEDTGRLLARLGAPSAATEGRILSHNSSLHVVTSTMHSSRSSAILPLQHRPADPE